MDTKYLQNLLAAGEILILSTRQHWFVLFQGICLDLILLLLLAVGLVILVAQAGSNLWAAAVVGIIPLFDSLRQILAWTNHQFIITNRRVIQVSGIINKNVIDSSLEKVNDVKLTQSLWGRVFGYGDVEILTASELGSNRFGFIGDPVQFKKAMIDAKNRLGGDPQEELSFKNVIKEVTIPDLIEELDALRIKGIITQEEFQNKKKDLLSRM
ncbi:MAG: PH domain-containing protein [Leptolinea sp.]|jgi:uncharacterized membrane protein YdbT with pleckstrin-like domain|nr:PH domain-containing protein [Leptolinea sp.]